MGTMPAKNLDAVFDALPTALVILEPNRLTFTVEEVNRAFLGLSGITRYELMGKPFFSVFKEYTTDSFVENIDKIRELSLNVLDKKNTQKSGIYQFQFNDRSQSDSNRNQYLKFTCSLVLNKDDSDTIDSLLLTVENVTDLLSEKEKEAERTKRISSRQELHSQHQNLVARAEKSEAQFESASQELDDFVYSVSHDLRAPLRRIDGFSQELMNSYSDKLDENGVHYLKRVRQGAQDMGALIDDLLKLSRISRKELEREKFDLGELAKKVFEELTELQPEQQVSFSVEKSLIIEADKGLVKAMLSNLISNALKFSSKVDSAEIRIGSELKDGSYVYYISDNGVGFNSAYNHKLFKAFSRLHSKNEFEGTGVGLATVKRIMTLHGGTVWAEGDEGEGATFYFKFNTEFNAKKSER